MSVFAQLERLNRLPIPDELKRAIEEALQNDEKVRDEITRLGVLEFIRRYGGEIRKMKEQTLPELGIRIGVQGDAKALIELADALEAEGFTGPNSIKALKGCQKWINGFAKDDRVHNKEHPRKWIFFAFDGDRLIGNVNGFVWDSPFPKKEEIEELRARYRLPDKRIGHIGIHVHPD